MSRELHRGLTRPPWDGVLPAVPAVLLVCPRLEEPAAWLPPSSRVPSILLEPVIKPCVGWAHWGSKRCKGLHQCTDPAHPSSRARHHGAQLPYGRATARLFSRLRTTALGPPSCSGEGKHTVGSATGSSDGYRATSTGQAARSLLPTQRSGQGTRGTPALITPTICTHTPSHPELPLARES